MGVIVREEYVCDYCGKGITDSNILIGKLALRKQGARGIGREVMLALHAVCSEKLTENSTGRGRARRPVMAAPRQEEPVAAPKTKPKPASRSRRRAPSPNGEAETAPVEEPKVRGRRRKA